ncbi:MAG: hypothetical protein RL095_1845 [Verrucomicrobiota bacterium]
MSNGEPGSTGVPPDVLCSSRSDGVIVAGGFNPRMVQQDVAVAKRQDDRTPPQSNSRMTVTASLPRRHIRHQSHWGLNPPATLILSLRDERRTATGWQPALPGTQSLRDERPSHKTQMFFGLDLHGAQSRQRSSGLGGSGWPIFRPRRSRSSTRRCKVAGRMWPSGPGGELRSSRLPWAVAV